jgi:hypothetical protein
MQGRPSRSTIATTDRRRQEHRLHCNDSWPVSAWIEGRYTNSDFSSFCSGCEIDQWSGLVGIRIFMDGAGTTLHDHGIAVPWDGGLVDVRYAPLLD